MTAKLYCKDNYADSKVNLNESAVKNFLQDNKVIYGIDQQILQLLLTKPPANSFPYTIAKGLPVKHGENGRIKYELHLDTVIDRTSDWDFRDVMRIPTVEKGQKLATVSLPTKGSSGMDVSGREIKADNGKPTVNLAGKHVVYRETDRSFYAAAEGQISVTDNYIQVHPVLEVDDSLSMKNGNLDFVGSIVIRGDVPSGYTVKAGGDIRVYGLVEAATVVAGGSIYISEGLAGQTKGTINAAENINIGYINQGFAKAGHDLFVENSIIHSSCVVKNHVYCQQGNIIGGSISAGKSIEAKDIGNRLNTKTEVAFGINKQIGEKEVHLNQEKKELRQTLLKLDVLGKKLAEKDHAINSKIRITMLRQQSSYNKAKAKLEKIEDKLDQLHAYLGSEFDAKLIVRNNIYTNVIVSFGKYKQIMKSDHHFIQMQVSKNEITIQPLFR